MGKFVIVDILILLLGILSIIGAWTTEISLETQYIPTVINGLASSLSLIVAFTGVSISLVLSIPSFKRAQNINRIILTILILSISIGLLWTNTAT